MPQSKVVDPADSIHGGYTVENCRKTLNEWCQKNQLPLPEIGITHEGQNPQTGKFIATTEFYVPQMQRAIQGRGEGSSKKTALAMCSLTLVRQLFHMGVVLEADSEAETSRSCDASNVSRSRFAFRE